MTKGSLSPRLRLCADSVGRGGAVLDIGTDHAYLPCFLAENQLVRLCWASDIADGPVSSALKTVASRGLSDRVFVIKSDGLKNIPPQVLQSLTDVVAAGMGGELIAEILSLKDALPEGVRFVLQPNTRAHLLRRFLYDSGLVITRERAVFDGKFVYTVIEASAGKYARPDDDIFLYAGELDPNEPAANEYIKRTADRLRAAAMGMKKSDPGSPYAEKNLEIAERLEKFADRG